MTTYHSGDVVVHPPYGVCFLEEVCSFSVDGVDVPMRKIRAPSVKMILYVPPEDVRRRVRPLATEEELKRAILEMKRREVPKEHHDRWFSRADRLQRQFETGKLSDLVAVICDLCNKNSFSERTLCELAARHFVDEYASVMGIPVNEALETIREETGLRLTYNGGVLSFPRKISPIW